MAEQAAANAAAAATMMHPPPVPYLVATAESTSSSIGLTQLAPSDSVVFSPDNLSIRTCESSSAESMLTPITEASRVCQIHVYSLIIYVCNMVSFQGDVRYDVERFL